MAFAVLVAVVALIVSVVNLFYTIELYNIFKEYETDMSMVLFGEDKDE